MTSTSAQRGEPHKNDPLARLVASRAITQFQADQVAAIWPHQNDSPLHDRQAADSDALMRGAGSGFVFDCVSDFEEDAPWP